MRKNSKSRFFLGKTNYFVVLVQSFCAVTALGVTIEKQKDNQYTYDVNDVRPSINLKYSPRTEDLDMPLKVLETRIYKSATDKRIEDIQIKTPVTARELAAFARQLAKPRMENKLYEYLSARIHGSPSKVLSDGTKRVGIDKAGFELMAPDRLARLYRTAHQNVRLSSVALNNNLGLRQKVFDQLGAYMSEKGMSQLWSKIQRRESLSMEEDLLPEFAKKMVRRFLVFRGPNCFHAALAFQGADMARAMQVNVKEEEGYHEAMINYDELWRMLSSAMFYEVDPSKAPLKYGDMLVFFDVSDENRSTPYFRWIRHAATYLIGPYTFSKGSKSPDTPYTIKTIKEEWDTWQKFSKRLGLKVFRRNPNRGTNTPPEDLVDWVY